MSARVAVTLAIRCSTPDTISSVQRPIQAPVLERPFDVPFRGPSLRLGISPRTFTNVGANLGAARLQEQADGSALLPSQLQQHPEKPQCSLYSCRRTTPGGSRWLACIALGNQSTPDHSVGFRGRHQVVQLKHCWLRKYPLHPDLSRALMLTHRRCSIREIFKRLQTCTYNSIDRRFARWVDILSHSGGRSS